MKITKTPKRLAEPMPEVSELLHRIEEAPDDELPNILDGISEWCWPRGDLHFWIQVLNRFDTILDETCRDYDLHKLQINEFTPLRKRILLSVLKFTRLLIENCMSRKLYASYEHLNHLLFTRDVDVLEATLRIMLRFSQQQSSQHPKAELVPSQEKLSTLAVTWPPRDHGLDMADIAKEETVIPPELLSVKFQFYRRKDVDTTSGFANLPQINEAGLEDGSISTPTRPRTRERVASTNTGGATGPSTVNAGSTSTQPQEGIDTIELGRLSELGSNAMDVLADVVEKTQGFPAEDQFELYQRIRLAMAMPNLAQRRQLIVCRLLAIACYAHIVPESVASTQLFLFEPEIVPRLAALVNPENKLSDSLVSGSLYALDALGRYRSKLHEVLGSLNASVNHGILLQILRNISDDLSTGLPTHCDDYVDAYLGLVSFITSTNIGSGMVVGAGLLQLLIKLVDSSKPESYMIQRTVTRAIGLLDSVIYAYVPAFTLFCQAHGLDIFVRRIEEEVNFDIEAASAKMDEGEELGPDSLYGKLTFGRAHLLKGYLQSISHMMVSTGTADGLRNLVDSSLLTSIKKIMEHRRIIGPQNLALAISIMATFVHNEPTSLGIIQEKKLPEAFLNVVKEDIEAQFDVINAIPNAIGALCLNQAGLDMFNAESIIDRLLSILTSERHIKILQDQDNVTVFGASIDELVRHQPTMKKAVLDGIFKVFDSIHQAGREYEAPETEKASMYRLSRVESVDSKESDAAGLEDTVNSATHQSMALADVIMDEADIYNRKDDALKDPNPVASFMDVTARFLEVLFQSSNHCKDFLRADGLEKLLSFYNLPCLSYNFASTVTADSMVHLLRFISEVNPNTVITALLREVKLSLEETKPLWNATEEVSALSKLLKPTTEYELTNCNEKFRHLIKLNARMQLLSDVAPTFTYSGSKTPTTLLQVLNTTPSIMAGNRDVATISDLGDFQRAWTWETILFKAATHTTSKAARLHDSVNGSSLPTPPENPLAAPLFQQQRESEVPKSAEDFDATSPLVRNTISLRYIASQVKIALNSFFLETNRLLVARRAHDSTHKRYATLTATQFGSILKQNMVWRPHAKVSLSCDYLIVMLVQAAKLLYEERPAQAMHSQTIVLVAFVKQGGLTQLLDDYHRFSDILERQCNSSGVVGSVEAPSLDEAVHACGGLQMALDLLLRMVNHTPLLESPSTQLLKSKDGISKDSSEYFEPRAFLISMRLAIAPVLRETWMKPWLSEVNLNVTRNVLRIILKLAEGQGEVSASAPVRTEPGSTPVSSNTPSNALMGLAHALGAPMGELSHGSSGGVRQRTAPTADEARLRQLTDMGFPRRAARHALIRCSNNLNAATEYLLMHPEVVNSMQGGDAHIAEGVSAEEAGNADGEAAAEGASSEETSSNAGVEAQESTNGGVPATTEQSGTDATAEDSQISPESADTPMAESNDAGEEVEKPEETVTKETSLIDTSNADLEQLEKERAIIMETLLSRALELCDKNETLAFDVRSAVRIATQTYSNPEPLKALFKSIEEAAPEALGSKMAFITVRLHLLALIFNDHIYAVRCASSRAKQFMQSLTTLIDIPSKTEEEEKIPTWIASFLLVISAIFQAEDVIPESKMIDKEDKDEHEMPRIWKAPLFEQEMPKLLEFSLQKLKLASKLPRDDLLALYRFLVIITRRSELASSFFEKEGLLLLVRPFSTLSLKDIARCRTYAVLIMRHIIESNAETLHTTMTQEVRSFFCQSRLKVMDTSSASKSLGPVILRQPDVFLDVMKNNIELVDYKPAQGQGIIKLPDTDRGESEQANGIGALASHGREGQTQASSFIAPLDRGPDESMELVPPSPTKQGQAIDESMLEVAGKAKDVGQSTSTDSSLDTVMHFLLSELLRVTRERCNKKSDSTNKEGSTDTKGVDEQATSDASYFYICFLLQSLTELLSSYKACKISFLNFTKKKLFNVGTSTATGKKEALSKMKQSGSVLTFFLTELVPLGFVQSREQEEMRRLMSISNWAMSTVVALCADVVAITTDIKDVGNEVVFARKTVLDGIAKAIKEAITLGSIGARAHEGIESRYGRLYSLSDLCYRLLKARPNVTSAGGNSTRSMDDLTLHMAKTMLERNFVTVLTSALAEVDLNLPMVKSLLERILKPLEYLTKVAIKMNKAERKNDKRKVEAEDLDGEVFESMDEDEIDDEEEDSEEEGGGQEAREETPDFYRNSSLGMHTGDLENSVSYDDEEDDEDEDEDEEMDEEMEGIVYSDDDTQDSDDDDIDEEHIVEVMEEDDDDDDDTEEEDDSDEEPDEDEEEVGSWIDEEDEDEESEELDFIIEGNADDAQRLFQHATGIFQSEEEGEGGEDEVAQVTYDVGEVEGDEEEDEEEDDMMDDEDESVLEGIFEHGDLSTMQAPTMHDHAPMDRFGATWTWTSNAASNPRQTRDQEGGAAENETNASQVISPFAFLRQRPANSRLSRSRRMNWDDALESMTPGIPQTSDGRIGREDVASHPLLTQAPSQTDLRGAVSSRLGRHHAIRRGGRGEEGFHDWAQSLEGLMEGGAMQFLETLLQRNGAGQGGPAEAIHISMTSGGVPRMGGGMPHILRAREGRSFILDRNLGGTGSERGADPVMIVQEFNPIPTLARWSEDMRIIAGSQADDRLRLMRAHIVNTLRPAYLIKQEEQRKKKEQMEEERKKAKERLASERQAEEEKEAKLEKEKTKETKLPIETEVAPSTSTDADVEMAEGGEMTAGPAAASSTPANLELNSLQQGLDELDSSAVSVQPSVPDTAPATAETTEMREDVAPSADSATAASTTIEAAAAAPPPRERVTTTINGNEVDITDSGIDPTFLEALPEDMREEVLNQHFRERRAAEAAASLAAAGSNTRSQPSNIAPEFLEALPPEIRAEVIQQEAAENERRRRDERRGEEARGPSDIDPASFLASLTPDLRGAVLMEQDESFLSSIPASMRQEVEAIRRQSQQISEARRRLYHRNGGMPGLPIVANSRAGGASGEASQDQNKKIAPRDAIQLLDKAGIAALVRLLFFPMMDSNQSGLKEVLVNLSENSKSRFELLNLLLMILAEGASEDSNAVDKSYNNMSVRINKAALQQTPTRPTPKRNNTTPGVSQAIGAGIPTPSTTATPVNTGSSHQPSLIAPLSRAGYEAPFLIASRSIETLIHLTTSNEQAAQYFLKDDPSNIGLMKWFKRNSNVKGKEREKVTSNAPINILLVLLGKPSILANAQLVDSLISLLNTVTRPLPSIVANRRKAEEEGKKKQEEDKTSPAKEQTKGEEEVSKETSIAVVATEEQPSVDLPMSAPQISEERMATVVKPLSISISSKGFQNTLAVASNLSTIEGARDVITSALQTEAKLASKNLMSELDDLLNSLPAPDTTGKTEEEEEEEEKEREIKAKESPQQLSCPALTKLASPSSSQTVILRSLRALEWVLTRPKTAPSAAAAPSTSNPSHHHRHHISQSYVL